MVKYMMNRSKKEKLGKNLFKWPKNKRAAVSLTFDDACSSQIRDEVQQLFKTYNTKVTFYVCPYNVKNHIKDWKKVVYQGHEIGNHTLTHPCSGSYISSQINALEEYTLERIASEIDNANKIIEDLLGVRPCTFAYPCGQKFVGRGKLVQSFVPLIADRFIAGRGFRDEYANDPILCDLVQLLGMESDGLSFDKMRYLTDIAIRKGRWLIFCGHEIGESSQTTSLRALEALCQYAQDYRNSIWMDTVEIIARYIHDKRI